MVYIQEAHPVDGWAYVKNSYYIKQHTQLQDRIEAARKLFTEGLPPKCPLLVDQMTNEATFKFSALPDRFCIINGGKLVFRTGVGPAGHDPKAVAGWLKENDYD